MTIKSIMESIVADGGPISLICIISMTLVQLSPIQINPWSTIFNWLGKQLNKEVMEKIESVENRLDAHISDSENAELKTRRIAILDFSSSVIRGVNYHKEKFEFMIHECDEYEIYCKENQVKNGVAEASISEIRRIYAERLRNDDFLRERIDHSDNKLSSREEAV